MQSDTPGVCSPSRNVVSRKRILPNKSIPRIHAQSPSASQAVLTSTYLMIDKANEGQA
jgi:hypothetical protein